jgi:16S rRNA (adenine1518-N6/adenine1519-N6)-dimethyltransferase
MFPKKSLGQNFLRDPKILKKIADFARIEPSDTVVEIGPGEGGLTKILLEKCDKLIVVEKDENLAEQLKQNFCEQITEDRLQVIVGDILDYNLTTVNYKLVGNIPYYITGAIFEKFLSAENPPKSMTFVVQKEVAERIVARDKKESILSISVKLYGTPEYGGTIKAGSFFPAPKVDSAIISVRNCTREKLQNGKMEEKKFFEILKKGFAHKRKLLIKNLGVSEEVFEKAGIPLKIRAEDLKVEDWITLTSLLATNY